MARLNITIPDDLYGRLEQHRDQLNLSRVCAASLQEEVDRLVGQPGPPDPAVTTLLLRLQGSYERWYGRGVADGRSWAAGQASPRELRTVATTMVEWDGEQLRAALDERQAYRAAPPDPAARAPLFPSSFDVDRALGQWAAEDGADEVAPMQQELLTYLEGWRDGVVALWTAAAPLLRRPVGGVERRQEGAGGVRPGEQTRAGTGSADDRVRAAAPAGWFVAGDKPTNYDVQIDTDVAYSGRASARIRSRFDDPQHFGTLMQQFRADAYRGKRLRLSAYVKAEDIEGWAGLWMRVDDPESHQQRTLGFDNMQDRPIRGTADWRQYVIVLDVPEPAKMIVFGVLLAGVGAIWVDAFRFEVVGTDVPVTWSGQEGALAPANLDFEE